MMSMPFPLLGSLPSLAAHGDYCGEDRPRTNYQPSFALLVHTAEDEQVDSSVRACETISTSGVAISRSSSPKHRSDLRLTESDSYTIGRDAQGVDRP